jgi:hypothetical protein
MKLTHWVPKKYATKVLNGEAKVIETRHFKPDGIWVDVDDSWKQWCESEEPDWIGDDYTCFKVSLKRGTKLLVIKGVAVLEQEWKKATGLEYSDMALIDLKNLEKFNKYLYKNYDGVHLKRKALEHRLNNLWIYAWDCESMVIFNPKNIIFKAG